MFYYQYQILYVCYLQSSQNSARKILVIVLILKIRNRLRKVRNLAKDPSVRGRAVFGQKLI
jgi:hypothetical protein